MKFHSLLIRALLAGGALIAVQMIVGAILPIPAPADAGNVFAWWAVAQLLSVGSLAFITAHVDWRGLRLGLALSAIPLAITTVNFIEGAVFLGPSDINWPRLFAQSFLTYAVLVPVWGLIFSRGREVASPNFEPMLSRPLGQRLWRFAISDIAYLVLYFTAGAIIFPYVRDFYATQSVPQRATIALLQLGLRGPVFVLVCLGQYCLRQHPTSEPPNAPASAKSGPGPAPRLAADIFDAVADETADARSTEEVLAGRRDDAGCRSGTQSHDHSPRHGAGLDHATSRSRQAYLHQGIP
jgi:hypothetical protein